MSAGIVHGHSGTVIAAVAVLAVYSAVLYSMPRHVFLSPDEGSKLIQSHTLRWEEGRFRYMLPYPGEWLDPAHEFHPLTAGGSFLYPARRPDGTLRFHWPVWFPLVSRFAFAAAGLHGIYLLPLLSGVLVALSTGCMAAFRAPFLPPAVILTVGFATPVFFYSVSFWEHTAATLLALLGALVLTRERSPYGSRPLLAAPLLFAAAMIRIELLAFAAAAVFAWAAAGWLTRDWPPVRSVAGSPSTRRRWSPRLRDVLLLGAILIVGAAFAQAMTARHSFFLEYGPAMLRHALEVKIFALPRSLLEILINTPRSEGPWVPLPWAVGALGGVVLCSMAALVTRPRLEAPLVLTGLAALLCFSLYLLFADQSYRSLHGIFPIAPYTVLGLYALSSAWRQRQRALFTVACLAVAYLVLGSAALFLYYVQADGTFRTGLEWGQRYMLTLYPLLAGLALTALRDYWSSQRPPWLIAAFTALATASICVGFFFQVRGLEMSRHHRQVLAAWDSVLRQDGPIATDLDWLPAALTDLFLTKELFLVQRPQLGRFSEVAMAKGVERFAFATQRPLREHEIAWIRPSGLTIRPYSFGGLHLIRVEPAADATDGR